MSQETTELETNCTEEIFQRMAGDLSMIADREIEVLDLETLVQTERPKGPGSVHISFRMSVKSEDQTHHGCLIVPFAEAITLAGSLMMLTDEMIETRRTEGGLDDPSKDAMLEVGNFIAGATEAAYRALDMPYHVSFEGCQGVRADVRPALIYEEGSALVVGKAKINMTGFGESQFCLMLPREACMKSQAA